MEAFTDIPIDLGFKGLQFRPGEHMCGLYAGAQQRDDILLPYLRAGLEAGDKCLCIVDGMEPAEIVAALGAPEVENIATGPKQLDVIRATDAYLRSGRFSAAEMLAVWKGAISEEMYLGRFAALRKVGVWSLRDVVPDMGELLRLEAELKHYMPLYPQVALCLYDVERMGSEIMADVIRLHSKVLVGGTIFENPLHVTPDELIALAHSHGNNSSSVGG